MTRCHVSDTGLLEILRQAATVDGDDRPRALTDVIVWPPDLPTYPHGVSRKTTW